MRRKSSRRSLAKSNVEKRRRHVYYVALESIRHALANDKWIFKVVSHVVNTYRERPHIYNDPTSNVSELDFMMKLWGEVLKLLIGDDKDLFIKWGETSTASTTAVRKSSNNNEAHTIGCKIDGRIVCRITKIVDTCHVEAAKASAYFQKILDDKFKLAAEAKCAIDDLVVSGRLSKERSVCLQSL